MINLNELLRLAHAADHEQEEPWEERAEAGRNALRRDAAFIAAANPKTVIALVGEVRGWHRTIDLYEKTITILEDNSNRLRKRAQALGEKVSLLEDDHTESEKALIDSVSSLASERDHLRKGLRAVFRKDANTEQGRIARHVLNGDGT